ncbi:hypothetical protein [Vibrio scophthalmi]|uniref:Uncharacterized protein n=1 Tax=Vibrio scophthalmi TaxID=45658 RepID=A0A1E3WES4_9VIBR|nr:hypothetical protein [Vibrio scophthalmi]ODS04301.1 hypothetical protein VSF3289_03432 [Vibrio scophthalmi]
MDTSDLIIEYSEGDFADAIRVLLPKGEYWQEADNPELTNTIEGMAADFKATHDEIELSLLTDFRERSFGWKLSDYQTLLNEIGSVGTVYDDLNTPNLIKVDLFSYDNDKAYAAFEEKRLPHTDFAWIYPIDVRVALICSTAISWELEIGEIA